MAEKSAPEMGVKWLRCSQQGTRPNAPARPPGHTRQVPLAWGLHPPAWPAAFAGMCLWLPACSEAQSPRTHTRCYAHTHTPKRPQNGTHTDGGLSAAQTTMTGR